MKQYFIRASLFIKMMNNKLNDITSRMKRTIDLFDRLYKGKLTSSDEVADELKKIWNGPTVPVAVVTALLEMSGYPDREARWEEAIRKCLNAERSRTHTENTKLPPGIQDEETAKRYEPYLRYGFDSKDMYERVRALVEDAVTDRIRLQSSIRTTPKFFYKTYHIVPEDLDSFFDNLSGVRGARAQSVQAVNTWWGSPKYYLCVVEMESGVVMPPMLRTIK